MNLIRKWDPVVEGFRARLSKWKSKTLSMGGRVTLIESLSLSRRLLISFQSIGPRLKYHGCSGVFCVLFYGGDEENRGISWILWDVVMLPKNKGGLGITPLKDSNMAIKDI